MKNQKNSIAALIITAYSVHSFGVLLPIAKSTDANRFHSEFEKAQKDKDTEKLIAKFKFLEKSKSNVANKIRPQDQSDTRALLSQEKRDDRISSINSNAVKELAPSATGSPAPSEDNNSSSSVIADNPQNDPPVDPINPPEALDPVSSLEPAPEQQPSLEPEGSTPGSSGDHSNAPGQSSEHANENSNAGGNSDQTPTPNEGSSPGNSGNNTNNSNNGNSGNGNQGGGKK